MFAAQCIEHAHDAVWRKQGVAIPLTLSFEVAELGDEFGKTFGLKADDVALLEQTLQILSLVGGLFGGNGKHIHVAVGFTGRVIPSVLEGAGFKGNVQQIAVHGVGLLHRGLDRDVVGLGILNHLLAAGELSAEFGITPRSNHLDLGSECGSREFEAYLIVALAGGPVSNGVGALLFGHFDHALGDAGPGDGGAQQVAALVDSVGLEHGKDEVAGELFLLVVNVALGGTGRESLLLEAVEFVTLSAVRTVGDDLGIVLLLEPEQENGGV